jgi:hypothetical protein
MAETSPYCGQLGRVCRVFWRAGAPWVLLRLSSGLQVPVPWQATDLPVPLISAADPGADQEAVLLSAAALVALLRFACRHRADPGGEQETETCGVDATGAGRGGVSLRADASDGYGE